MLFISILLSVWSVLWLAYAIMVKDFNAIVVTWIESMLDDEEDDIDPLLEKGKAVYHLSCKHCNHLWWSIEPNVNFCPKCGKKQNEEQKEK